MLGSHTGLAQVLEWLLVLIKELSIRSCCTHRETALRISRPPATPLQLAQAAPAVRSNVPVRRPRLWNWPKPRQLFACRQQGADNNFNGVEATAGAGAQPAARRPRRALRLTRVSAARAGRFRRRRRSKRSVKRRRQTKTSNLRRHVADRQSENLVLGNQRRRRRL